jgi:enediyne biosynthesis protein E4
MNPMRHIVRPFRRQAARIAAVAAIAVLYWLARLPEVSADARAALSARFHFTPTVLSELPGSPHHVIRPVHPALTRIQAWVSSLGASAALHDLDGDGLPDDLCTVDPRSDRVVIEPVPGTGSRYEAFALDQPDRRGFVVPTGCVPGDLNEDGLPDLLVLYWGRPPIAYLRRAGSERLGPASFDAVEVWRGDEIWNTNTATLADVDGDGHLDIFVGNYFPDGVRLLDPSATGPAPMNRSMSRASNGGRNRLLLWTGAGGGDRPWVRFRDASDAMPEESLRRWTHAVGAADLDGDGLPELYIANDFGPDQLFHNESSPGHVVLKEVSGRRTWTTPASKVLGHDSFKGMGVDFGDVNGDLIPDIYVSNIAVAGVAIESHFMFLSEGPIDQLRRGIAPYVDRSEPLGVSRSGWAWDCKLADFDNDGVLEAIQATGFVRGTIDRWPEVHELTMNNDELLPWTALWPRVQAGDDISGHELKRFFTRTGPGPFTDVAPDLHLEPADDPFVTRGIAIADVDGDGDLDFVLANQWQPFVFYRNDAPHAGRSVNLRVLLPVDPAGGAGDLTALPSTREHVRRGRRAVGATVTLTARDGRKWVGLVDGGNGHTGRRSADVHFGLGEVDAGTALEARVTWHDALGRHVQTTPVAPGWQTVWLDQPDSARTDRR